MEKIALWPHRGESYASDSEMEAVVLNEGTVLAAFSEEDVERLTNISKGQLRYWDRTKFFAPSLADENRRWPNSRVYSFRDVVCLKILNALRNEAKVSLPHLRDVREGLLHLGDDLWAKTTLYVLNRRVVFYNPETSRKEDIVTGQGVLQIPLRVVSGDMKKAVRLLWARDEKTVGNVGRSRGVASSQLVIAGTRIPVRAIKAFSEAGYSIKQICKQYPTLTPEDIRAALEYGEAA